MTRERGGKKEKRKMMTGAFFSILFFFRFRGQVNLMFLSSFRMNPLTTSQHHTDLHCSDWQT